jgi:hypothetical protein
MPSNGEKPRATTVALPALPSALIGTFTTIGSPSVTP